MSDIDHLALTKEWEQLHAASLSRQLTEVELRKAIEITRVLRQTNTGPARKKRAAKGPLSDDALDALLKG